MIDMQNKTPRNMEVLFPCYGGFCSLFISYSFTNSARIAFTTAMTITPTSAKMAAHMLAIPAPKQQAAEFDAEAKINVLIYDADTFSGN